MEAQRKRRNASRMRVHFACGVFVGAIAGFFIWARMATYSVPEGFAPTSAEQWVVASGSPLGGVLVIGGTAIIAGLLAAVKDDEFWTDLGALGRSTLPPWLRPRNW